MENPSKDNTENTGNDGITDTSDYNENSENIKQATEENPRSRNVKAVVLVIVLALLAVAIGGYAAIRSAGIGDDSPDEETAFQQEERLPDAEEELSAQDGENPFSEVFDEDDISIPDGSMQATLDEDNNGFIISEVDLILSADENIGEAVETSGAECDLVGAASICYAGYVEVDDGEDIQVHAIRNIAENRLFEASVNTESIEIEGAKAAFSGILSIESQDYSEEYVALAGSNGSGFILLSDNLEDVPGSFSVIEGD